MHECRKLSPNAHVPLFRRKDKIMVKFPASERISDNELATVTLAMLSLKTSVVM